MHTVLVELFRLAMSLPYASRKKNQRSLTKLNQNEKDIIFFSWYY
jgi:hypothetical protein